MNSKRLIYLIGCFVLGLANLLKEVKGKNGSKKCKYPAIYNFGDSNSDTGTLSAAFTMVHPPNGESFPGSHLSKRVCDGRLIIDFICEELKVQYLSAYLDSIGSNYRHGANFATGGASILKGGYNPFHLEPQIAQFMLFKSRTMALYNRTSSNGAPFKSMLPRPEGFSKALYTIDIGQNDLTFGFMSTSEQNVKASIPHILTHFSQGLQQLYKEGARVFWIHNTGPIGCLPRSVLHLKQKHIDLDSSGCIKLHNEIAQEFNKQLKERVFELRKKLHRAKFVYVDVYTAKYELIRNARKLGFVNPQHFCCGNPNSEYSDCGFTSTMNGEEKEHKCERASRHISWDGLHFSEAANLWLAKRILNGTLSDPQVAIGKACKVNTKTSHLSG